LISPFLAQLLPIYNTDLDTGLFYKGADRQNKSWCFLGETDEGIKLPPIRLLADRSDIEDNAKIL
jgi:hypothetical protein